MCTGETIYSAEKNGYLREIDALQLKAAKIEELEAENRKLNAELEDAKRRHRRCSDSDGARGSDEVDRSSAIFEADAKTENLTVDIEEYHRVKEELAKLERDYGRLAWARDHLAAKVREKNDSIKQWKEYRKNWILNHPNQRLNHLRPGTTRASSVIATENRRSSSAPAPPVLPDGLTPGASGVSRSPSPHHNTRANPKDIEYWGDQINGHHAIDQKPQSHENRATEIGRITAHADSSDATEATPESKGHAEPIKIEPATDSSSPIVVFERSLKRRHSARANDQKVHVHEDEQHRSGARSRTAPPKDEQSSSPSQLSPRIIFLDGRNDSLDLDDVGGHLDTPRKRQRMAQERLMSSMIVPLTTIQSEEDTTFFMTAGANSQRFGDEHLGSEGEQDEETRLSTENNKTLRRKTIEEEKKASRDKRMARQHAHNNRIYQRLEAAEHRDPALAPPESSSSTTDESARHPSSPHGPREDGQGKPCLVSPVVLQPRDANASVLPRTSDPFTSRKRPCPPSRRDRGAAHVPALAEDGEGLSSKSDALKSGKKPKDEQSNLHSHSDKEPKAPPTYHRLGALLTKPSPEKSFLVPEEHVAISPDQTWSKTPLPQSVYHSRSKGPATPQSLPAKKSQPKRGSDIKADPEPIDAILDRHSKSAQPITKISKVAPTFAEPSPISHPETRPEHEPLRARPLHRLSLQDFKLNPVHGDYAYHESARRHDEKKSLSGCTDRNCQRCKGLRKYVIDSGYKTAPNPGESQDDADRRLVQDFLGDNHRKLLKTMSPSERSDLLLEAKVKEFANRFGCHRQAFSRAREPPGFWEVDFPTTQEEADNRAMADVLEREKVRERYWEASRSGGKWLFADE